MNDTIFKIREVSNGFILECDNEEIVCLHQSSHTAFVEFLNLIKELYGPTDNRYSCQRISVNIEPGSETVGLSGNAENMISEILSWRKEYLNWSDFGEKMYLKLSRMLSESKRFKDEI